MSPSLKMWKYFGFNLAIWWETEPYVVFRMYLLTAFPNKMWHFWNLGQIESSFPLFRAASATVNKSVTYLVIAATHVMTEKNTCFYFYFVHKNGQTQVGHSTSFIMFFPVSVWWYRETWNGIYFYKAILNLWLKDPLCPLMCCILQIVVHNVNLINQTLKLILNH